MRTLNQYIYVQSICMSDNRLTYHRQKFEEEILVKKQEPKCRIWNCEEVEDITIQLCDLKGTFPRTNRSLKHFHVIEASQVKELRYIDPYNTTSLKVIAVEICLNSCIGHGNRQDSQGGNLYTTK